MLDDDQEGLRNALQVLGMFGLVVTAVIQMRVVAQLLRPDAGSAPGDRT